MPKCIKLYKNKDKAKKYRKKHHDNNYNKNDYSVGKRRKWETWEEQYILNNENDVEIAKYLQRSLRAIHIKRCRLKQNY